MSREIEDNINTANQVVCNVIVSDISVNDFHLIGNPVQVEWISSLLRQECVDNYHFDTQLDEAAREIAANESHAARDKHSASVILRTKVDHFLIVDFFQFERRNRIRRSQSRTKSKTVWITRQGVKNSDRP